MAVLIVGAIHFPLQVSSAVPVIKVLVVLGEFIPRIPLPLDLLVDRLCASQFLAEFVGLALEFLLGFALLLRVPLRLEALRRLQPLRVSFQE